MLNNSRRPQIGDLVLVLHEDAMTKNIKIEETPFAGIVYKLTYDKWGHESALIEWSGSRIPKDYKRKKCYNGVNIHNLRGRFKIFRDGTEIL